MKLLNKFLVYYGRILHDKSYFILICTYSPNYKSPLRIINVTENEIKGIITHKRRNNAVLKGVKRGKRRYNAKKGIITPFGKGGGLAGEVIQYIFYYMHYLCFAIVFEFDKSFFSKDC